MVAHGGDPQRIARSSSDISAFIAGVRDHLANAQMTFGRFYIMKCCPKRSTRYLGDGLT